MPHASTPAVPDRPASYVISLRPAGEHATLARAAAAHGLELIALSPWRIVHRDDDAARAALATALDAPLAIFTSPPAVAAASALMPLTAAGLRLAVGAGSCAALRAAGVADAVAPEREDSEGLLAMPQLATGEVRGRTVGLVTAPGGRGRIAAELATRGARVVRADVYVREPLPLDAEQVARLLATGDAPLLLPLTSGEALQRVLDALPAAAAQRLRTARVVAASERLAELARDAGFAQAQAAHSPRPEALLMAALADS
ncbi:uroporphyrinogen-III synthase [Luteimonas yindakuii]|uniref:Uroporphyrinogen-III synthase n=1 Tax=Luteimonas yindakuii TaxID=2565782 RepID=A0A4Z1R3Q6_9GAMM|nr:uroporphyrinogen-III synthase [Luteimonas yindakuii]TKS53175.1 uroporphyrinogen-III synthase [Luteimonas yindakuii]